MRVLVVEDDNDTAAYIVDGLRQGGHVADHVADGRDALFLATSNTYDVMVVDRMLPGLEGLALVAVHSWDRACKRRSCFLQLAAE